MYYGYNDNRQLLLADEEFIELLGYKTFEELLNANIIDSLKRENNRIIIDQEYQSINADFMHHKIYAVEGSFYLVELKNTQVHTMNNATLPNLKPNYKAIYLNVHKIAEEIGLSVNDYKLYLDSFIDQSIIDEKRLLEGNDKVVKNLSNLALTLKIPHINILLLKIQKLSHKERIHLIDEYYTKLALLTLEKPEGYEEEKEDALLESDAHEENKEEILNARFSDLLNTVISEKSEEQEEPSYIKNVPVEKIVQASTEIETLSFENITPLPISYNPQTAADELNLPVVLIEEFVDDFIEQARQDKDHLLTSYYQKDMNNIHELGHKLKGAASNLRIDELSDILEEIQFCKEHEQLKELFIKYWGHFLSLEAFMKQLKRV